ncbi:MAG: SLAP domain-containing protein [Bacillus sp. (in: firmicutes)]
MQKLIFESAWDKTISQKDRKAIEQAFQKADIIETAAIPITPLWQAINHKGDLLATVIIHNINNKDLFLNHTRLNYFEENTLIAEYAFKVSAIILPPKTSMPWTFIFPKESLIQQPSLQNGYLQIEE